MTYRPPFLLHGHRLWLLDNTSQQPTGLQVELTEILGGAEGDDHHTMPEDVLLCGHLEIDLGAGDQTVLLDHWVDSLHPAVPEVYPVAGGMEGQTSGAHNDNVADIPNNLLGVSRSGHTSFIVFFLYFHAAVGKQK